ncbi:MAG: hypothetical protein C0490_15845, partial [Marivirga sp.]|nr:hypothetical protein [Marivirga sp.]
MTFYPKKTNRIKFHFLTLLALTTFVSNPVAYGQKTSQTVRGRITDEVTQSPLVGVSIRLEGVEVRSLGSTTDENGDYRIEQVPVGRQTLVISYIGYETRTIPNIVITAGKEVILNIGLQESVSQLSEITVTADPHSDKTA